MSHIGKCLVDEGVKILHSLVASFPASGRTEDPTFRPAQAVTRPHFGAGPKLGHRVGFLRRVYKCSEFREYLSETGFGCEGKKADVNCDPVSGPDF